MRERLLVQPELLRYADHYLDKSPAVMSQGVSRLAGGHNFCAHVHQYYASVHLVPSICVVEVPGVQHEFVNMFASGEAVRLLVQEKR